MHAPLPCHLQNAYEHGEAETCILVRQGFVKKRTRHTRRLGRRWLRLCNSELESYKKYPYLQTTAMTPTCRWSIYGCRIRLQQNGSAWQVSFAQATILESQAAEEEEVELMFDCELQAARWHDWLSRAARFGSLTQSYTMLTDMSTNRSLNGTDLPGPLKMAASLIPQATWAKTIIVKHVGLLKIPFLTVQTTLKMNILDLSYQGLLPILICVHTQHSESRFILDYDKIEKRARCKGQGGIARSSDQMVGSRRVTVVEVEVPLLHRVEYTDLVEVRVFSPHPPEKSDRRGFLGRGAEVQYNEEFHQSVGLGEATLRGFGLKFAVEDTSAKTNLVQGMSARCSVLPFHVCDDVCKTEEPFLNEEWSYHTYIKEARRMGQMITRMRDIYLSYNWLYALSQPFTTLLWLLYMSVWTLIHPEFVLQGLVLLPMMSLLISKSPIYPDLQKKTLLHCPLLTIIFCQESLAFGCKPECFGLKGIQVIDTPVTENLRAHGGVFANSRVSLKGLQAIRAIWKLFLWTAFGGWPSASAWDTFVQREKGDSKRRVSLIHTKYSVTERVDTSQCVSLSRFLLNPLIPLRVEQPSLWKTAILRHALGQPCHTSQDQAFFDETEETPQTIPQSDIATSRVPNRHENSVLKYALGLLPMQGGREEDSARDSPDENMTRSTPLEGCDDETSRKKAKGLRGVIRDAASVGRFIVQWRRHTERFLNLFEWHHPLASMAFLVTLTFGFIASLIWPWPYLVFFLQVNSVRRAFQISQWKRCLESLANLEDLRAGDSGDVKSVLNQVKIHPDFAQGPLSLSSGKGWIASIIDHSFYNEQILHSKVTDVSTTNQSVTV